MRRAAICLAFAALWPLLPAMLTFSVFELMDHLWPGMLTFGQFQAVYWTGAVLSAAGSTAAVLKLPVRY